MGIDENNSILKGNERGECFFFTIRRRHTRSQNVTGVQTCALPIYWLTITLSAPLITNVPVAVIKGKSPMKISCSVISRSEERRVGKECVSTLRSPGGTDQ